MLKQGLNRNYWNSVQFRLLRAIIAISTTAAIIATSAQLLLDFRKGQSVIDAELDALESSHIPGIRVHTWRYDLEAVLIAVNGLLSNSNLKYAAVMDPTGKRIFEKGQIPETRYVSRKYSLDTTQDKVGTLVVYASLDNLYERMIDSLSIILVTNLIKTLIVASFILLIIRRTITSNLNRIVTYLEKLDFDKMNPPLSLGKSDKGHEFKVVVGSINRMVEQISAQIDEIKGSNEDLTAKVDMQTKEIQNAFQEKSNLLRVVCHDIANPLSTIHGHAKLMKRKINEDHPLEKHANRISKAATVANDILKHVREYESHQAGKREVHLEPIDLVAILDGLKDQYLEKLERKELQLEIKPKSPLPLRVQGEEVALRNEIFSNLISNAIKFSFRGGVIRVEIERLEGLIKISVHDAGVGMPKNLLNDLFDPTKKTSRLGTEEESGTGFGMPLVKSYTDLLGGSIEVTSKEASENSKDSGTIFHICLLDADYVMSGVAS